jgi:cytochrome c oxidase subunit IV
MADKVTHAANEVEHGHPGAKTYIVIAVILAIITAAEVAVFYVPALESVLAFLLLTMSAAKFILVVMFYMHLKFDSRVFSGVFLAPLSLALFMVIGIVLLFRVLPLI